MITTAKHQKLNIPSDAAYMLKIEGMIDELGSELELTEEQAANVYVAVSEAVKNAIVFGNQSNPDKHVNIVIDKEDNNLYFTISDEGKGFDFNDIPDPTSAENIEKITGRGVFLMRNLADKVEFENNGSVVKLTFVFA